MTAALHAILVGINEYQDMGFLPLKHSVDDARKMKNILQKLGANESDIRVLEDSYATLDGITEALQALSTRAQRNDAIIFFFSGYAALSGDDTEQEGVLCPYDTHSSGGLSEKSLLRALDVLAKRCGNNITVFLDTSGDALKWNNPSSCVVVYPNQASEDQQGGTFTSAAIKVLEEHCSRFDSIPMTVETFAKRVESGIRVVKDDILVIMP
ncbi:hypothetical protein GYMLUDRAFT_408483 [Collybiopsis luxurians FD-317 M1]|uniref:Peptidase C14 caspase domain-containing protein n=1 Tax=Collybiopsis luxurians FD-317 M1 TaxID=944289 RepID=A0A0D0C8J9_9AGAR|nr:hypothetical protein GYMLUDRAFT_408483 [Collybiopsis luxurians FD-317 M1]